jgi:hypothetical protein
MSDLHARERIDAESGGLIVEFVEENRVVGMAYLEEDGLLAEFYTDEDGDPWVFEADDLLRALDTAAAMLGAADDTEETPEGDELIAILAAEFDPQAAGRGPEDEGFYPLDVVVRMVNRCGELDLAVASIEGLTLHTEGVTPVPGCSADLADAYQGEPWGVFQAGCNLQAISVLERWPRRPEMGVSIEIQDRSGERYVL